MSWFWLLLAGLFEVVWAVGLKYSHGFTRFWPTAGTLAAMTASVFLLAVAVKALPLGTAYAVWTGIGAVGTVVFGMIAFGDPVTTGRIVCLAMIIGGIAGLKLLSSS